MLILLEGKRWTFKAFSYLRIKAFIYSCLNWHLIAVEIGILKELNIYLVFITEVLKPLALNNILLLVLFFHCLVHDTHYCCFLETCVKGRQWVFLRDTREIINWVQRQYFHFQSLDVELLLKSSLFSWRWRVVFHIRGLALVRLFLLSISLLLRGAILFFDKCTSRSRKTPTLLSWVGVIQIT